jgi:hypothetical protein
MQISPAIDPSQINSLILITSVSCYWFCEQIKISSITVKTHTSSIPDYFLYIKDGTISDKLH